MKWIKNLDIDNTQKHIIKLSFVSLLVIIAGIFIINFLFQQHWGIKLLEAEWSAGDALSFFGTILTIVGTVISTCIGVKMTIEEERKKDLENEKNYNKRNNSSYLLLSDSILKLAIDKKTSIPNLGEDRIILTSKNYDSNSSYFFELETYFDILNNVYPIKALVEELSLNYHCDNTLNKNIFVKHIKFTNSSCEHKSLTIVDNKKVALSLSCLLSYSDYNNCRIILPMIKKIQIIFTVSFLNSFDVTTKCQYRAVLTLDNSSKQGVSEIKGSNALIFQYKVEHRFCDLINIDTLS